MARIQSEELERLKAEISLERLAEAAGVKLKRHGKDLLGLCPFHNDRRPSLNVSPAKQIFKCFSCGAGGDVFKFTMLRERLSFTPAQAADALAAWRVTHPETEAVLLSTCNRVELYAASDSPEARVCFME